MSRTKEEMVSKGWVSIGFDRELEYLAKENEHGDVLFIPVYDGKCLGMAQSHNKTIINLLHKYIN